MHIFAAILGSCLVVVVLLDAFETVVLARRAGRMFRITAAFYQLTWLPYAAVARRIKTGRRRENYLSFYGALSVLILLVCWAVGLILAFGLLQWSIGLKLNGVRPSLINDIYFSATTFFTLGLGDPRSLSSKYLMVLEAGLGYSFLGLVIGYLPIFYQSFSTRETRISLLDARAGSPPSAGELVVRAGTNSASLEQQLANWEEWAAELLQSQLSYPMLAYFRSQHTNQSWLGALVAIIDASALVILGAEGSLKRQGELTFAMGRHALVDLATVFATKPRQPHSDRLSPETLAQLRSAIAASKAPLRAESLTAEELEKLRAMYEPYAVALGIYFLMALPHWLPSQRAHDNWELTSWGRISSPFAVSDPFQHKPE